MREHEPEVRRWFTSRVTAREDIEDLVQECMCAIIESYHSFRQQSSVRTWVFGICRNLFFRYQRQKIRRALPLVGEHPDRRLGRDPVDALGVRLAAETLPHRLRSVYDLHYLNGQTIKEISLLLTRPEGTIKYQLHEIRSILRRRIGGTANNPDQGKGGLDT